MNLYSAYSYHLKGDKEKRNGEITFPSFQHPDRGYKDTLWKSYLLRDSEPHW